MSRAQSPRAPGSLAVERTADGVVLHLRGEVDTATVMEFERGPAAGDGAWGPAGDVHTVDVSAATFVNSVAIGLIMRQTASARRAGHRPRMRGSSRQVRQVFDIVGLSDFFEW